MLHARSCIPYAACISHCRMLHVLLCEVQLTPAPVWHLAVDRRTTRGALEARASQMTDIQKQIREDTTRYRCGMNR